ncbi:MAG TPA: hypothetical protein VNR88_08670 [Hyphomicrobium sp.]|nr:hypothetical protein [Hyphomicrobium sp.]
MRTTIALGSAAFATLALFAVSHSEAKAEFYRTPSGEVKYRRLPQDFQGPYYFYYKGYAYPHYPGLAYRERTGELRPTDVPHRERVQR